MVENNYLSAPQRKAKDADRAACGKDTVCLQATDARWAEVSQEQSREVMERYAPYLTPDEQYVLFSLKPGTKEYDQILASAIARRHPASLLIWEHCSTERLGCCAKRIGMAHCSVRWHPACR